MKETAQLFKALSDDTRLRILGLLLERELCVCDLMAILNLPQSTVSRHLSYLKNSGLVDDRRQGVWMYYRLVERKSGPHRDIDGMLHRLLPRLSQVQEDKNALKRHLSRKMERACG